MKKQQWNGAKAKCASSQPIESNWTATVRLRSPTEVKELPGWTMKMDYSVNEIQSDNVP